MNFTHDMELSPNYHGEDTFNIGYEIDRKLSIANAYSINRNECQIQISLSEIEYLNFLLNSIQNNNYKGFKVIITD